MKALECSSILPCLTEPMPARHWLSQAKAEPINDGASAFEMTYLRREKKTLLHKKQQRTNGRTALKTSKSVEKERKEELRFP